MPRHGAWLLLLLFGLLHIEPAYCETGASGTVRGERPVPDPKLWKAVPVASARRHPFSTAVRIRSYNYTKLNSEPYPGIGPQGSCSGTMIAWNMVLTAAHCFYEKETGYAWELTDMVPGGPGGDVEEDKNGVEQEFDIPFGLHSLETSRVIQHDSYIHPMLLTAAERANSFPVNDVAVAVLETPIFRSEHFPDATMELNMLESFVPSAVDPDVPAAEETLSSNVLTFHHFPAEYPQWLGGWGRMHYSWGQDVTIEGDGVSVTKLNQLFGSSGASIRVTDETDEADVGSTGGSRIRIIHTAKNNDPLFDGTEYSAFGVALTPEHVYWIGSILHLNKANRDDLDGDLAISLETEVCMCEYTDGSITVKLVSDPVYLNCKCAGGSDYTNL